MLKKSFTSALCLCSALALVPGRAGAETMSSALSRAYMGNPDINQQRASVRATDENLPRALSAFRPTVTATGNAGAEYLESRSNVSSSSSSSSSGSGGSGSTIHVHTRNLSFPRGVGVSVQENLYNGERTRNSAKQAESQIDAARETMRLTEQNTLQNGATAYMNVLRDTAILNLRRTTSRSWKNSCGKRATVSKSARSREPTSRRRNQVWRRRGRIFTPRRPICRTASPITARLSGSNRAASSRRNRSSGYCRKR